MLIRKRLIGAVDWTTLIISSMLGFSLRAIMDIISKSKRLDTQFFEGLGFLVMAYGAASYYQPFSINGAGIVFDKINYPLMTIALGAASIAVIKMYNSLKKLQSKET